MHFLRKHKCLKCDRKFGQVEELMHHELIAHGNPLYDCKECNLNFSSMEEMRTHMQRKHQYKGKI